MTLTQELQEYVRACFTGLWIESFEHEEALREMDQLCHQQEWRLLTWDIDQDWIGRHPTFADPRLRSASRCLERTSDNDLTQHQPASHSGRMPPKSS